MKNRNIKADWSFVENYIKSEERKINKFLVIFVLLNEPE